MIPDALSRLKTREERKRTACEEESEKGAMTKVPKLSSPRMTMNWAGIGLCIYVYVDMDLYT